VRLSASQLDRGNRADATTRTVSAWWEQEAGDSPVVHVEYAHAFILADPGDAQDTLVWGASGAYRYWGGDKLLSVPNQMPGRHKHGRLGARLRGRDSIVVIPAEAGIQKSCMSVEVFSSG
jgi:hypothetical protein